MDIPTTGRKVTVDEIVIFRISGRKIVEAWEVFDEWGMRQQLGVI
jgi:predicted ester cyclase